MTRESSFCICGREFKAKIKNEVKVEYCETCTGRMEKQVTDKLRDCLGCGNPFMSEHKGNRICGTCKNTVEYRSNGDYNVGTIPSFPKGQRSE